jgi:LPPG:FO 2-phospho-L-lactate transferase
VDTVDADQVARLEQAGLRAGAAPLWMHSTEHTSAMAAAAIALVA